MELFAAIAGSLAGTSLSPEMWVAAGLVVAFAKNPRSFMRALLVAALLLVGLRAAVLRNFGFLPATLAALALWSSLGWGLRALIAKKLIPRFVTNAPPANHSPAIRSAHTPIPAPKTSTEHQVQKHKHNLWALSNIIKSVPYIVSVLGAICLAVIVYFSVQTHQTVMLLKTAYLADKAAQVLPDCIKAARAAGFDLNPFSERGDSAALAAEYLKIDAGPLKLIRDFHPDGSRAHPRYLVFLIDMGDLARRGYCKHHLASGETEFINPDSKGVDPLEIPYP